MCIAGYSVETITSKLYKMGFRNKHGNRVAKSSIIYILHNTVYIGKFYFDDVSVENTEYPILISESMFYLAQDKLDAPYKTRQTHTQFPYTETIGRLFE